MKSFSGHIAMLLCVFCWSTSGLFIQLIDWHPLVISCIRSAIAAVFMLIVQGPAMFTASSWKAARAPVCGIPVLFIAAGASALTKILYVTANKMTSPANAILLQHSAPIWAAVLGWFAAGEKLRKAQFLALCMTITGIFLFMFESISYGRLAGDTIAILCGITFALSMVFLRKLKDGSPALALFFSHLLPVIIGIPFLFTHPPRWTAMSAGAILFLGLVQIGIASLLYAYSIKRIGAIDAMLIAQLEPVLNPLWVFIGIGQIPSTFVFLGGSIIIAAVIVANIQLPRIKTPICGRRIT